MFQRFYTRQTNDVLHRTSGNFNLNISTMKTNKSDGSTEVDTSTTSEGAAGVEDPNNFRLHFKVVWLPMQYIVNIYPLYTHHSSSIIPTNGSEEVIPQPKKKRRRSSASSDIDDAICKKGEKQGSTRT